MSLLLAPNISDTNIFCYGKPPFGPMSVNEAADCLYPLVEEVAVALEDLHRLGFAHQDLRLLLKAIQGSPD